MCLVWLLVFFSGSSLDLGSPTLVRAMFVGVLWALLHMPLCYLYDLQKQPSGMLIQSLISFFCIKYCQLGLKYVPDVLWFYDVIPFRSLVKCGCELASAPGALPVTDGTSFAG